MPHHTDSHGNPITWRTCAVRLREDQVRPIYETLTENEQWRVLLPHLRKYNGQPFSRQQCQVFDQISPASRSKMVLNVWFTQIPTLWKMRKAFIDANLKSLVQWMDTLATENRYRPLDSRAASSSSFPSNTYENDAVSCSGSYSASTNEMAPFGPRPLGPYPGIHFDELSPERLEFLSMEEVKKIANNFTEGIGEGSFGGVYKGQWCRQAVAVKRLTVVQSQFFSHRTEYHLAVAFVGRLCHQNILKLLGHAKGVNPETSEEEFALIYEYMPLGDLASHIKNDEKRKKMDSEIRFRIAQGTISGLAYFNSQVNDFGNPYVHRDVKSANILLDEHYQPKLADFGCLTMAAKGTGNSFVSPQEITSGTAAYMAPETQGLNGTELIITAKADTYAFGIVLFELLFGKLSSTNFNYRETAKQKAPADKIITWSNIGEGSTSLPVAQFFRFLGLYCTVPEWNLRPSTMDVLTLIESRDLAKLQRLSREYVTRVSMKT